MKKKVVLNILYLLFLITFLVLSFFKNHDNNQIPVELIFENEFNLQYVDDCDVYKKINIDCEKKIVTHDINTRLLEDSIESLQYVRNAEVYLSLNNKLTIFIEQERPFIRTIIGGDTCFLSQSRVKLNITENKSPDVLFFIDDKKSDDEDKLELWNNTVYLTNYLQNDSFLDFIITKVTYHQDTGYILYSDFFEFGINIGMINKLDQKTNLIKLFFSSIVKDIRLRENNKLLIKELNVAYDSQIICVM